VSFIFLTTITKKAGFLKTARMFAFQSSPNREGRNLGKKVCCWY